MKVSITAFGIARDILKSSKIELELEENASLGTVKSKLLKSFPDFDKLRSLKFAVNQDYQEDQYRVVENDEIVIIPPVSGG